MNRRNFIAGTAGAGAAAIGGVALFGGSAAAASIDGEFENAGDTVSATTNGGEFEAIEVEASDVTFGYDGLDEEAVFAIVTLSSEPDTDDGDYQLVAYEMPTNLSGQKATGVGIDDNGNVEGSTISGDLLKYTEWEASDFEAPSDNDDYMSTTTTVPLQLDVWVFFGDEWDASEAADVVVDVDLTDPEYTPQDATEFLDNNGGVEGENYVHNSDDATVDIEIINEDAKTGTSGQAGATIETGE